MNATQMLEGTLPIVAAPAQALADAGAVSERLDVGGVAVLGVVAALAWHHVALHRHEWALRWRGLHLSDRWRGLHVGDRFHALHLGAVAARLHLPRGRPHR